MLHVLALLDFLVEAACLTQIYEFGNVNFLSCSTSLLRSWILMQSPVMERLISFVSDYYVSIFSQFNIMQEKSILTVLTFFFLRQPISTVTG